MTVAKGHQNPFGTEDYFARKYIGDSKQTARHLNKTHIEEFRSTVFGYMSRVRRADAKLSFPTRKVKLHWVRPTKAELALIAAVHQEISGMNKLVQISLLKALVSSPQALMAQLENMQSKESVPLSTVAKIGKVAGAIPITSKLRGLDVLIEQLRGERAKDWRMVIFTQSRHTQRAIVEYLRSKGLVLGEINGDSDRRNQDTIRAFSTVTPEINVIVSTEAGAEGVNLQVANVLVNYDLPWNPMIVEQRIGRIQRLGSKHAHVTIFNAIMQGTFEESIVGRLMEKLQMASHAIGDIDSILEAAGIEGEDPASSFEEMIRSLVMASLAGKDIAEDTRLRIESIERAQVEITREEENINSLLGAPEDPLQTGPRAPKMSPPHRSMAIDEFVILAFKSMNRHLKEEKPGIFIDTRSGDRICFDESLVDADSVYTPLIYSPGRPEFDRLVGQFRNGNECMIEGLKFTPRQDLGVISTQWVRSIGGAAPTFTHSGTTRTFSGTAILRARISVAHDSFEKIIDADCASQSSVASKPSDGDSIDPGSLELDNKALLDAIQKDPDVREFIRFYLERRDIEVKAAGRDNHKQAKLREDFTPRMEPSLVGLSGSIKNRLQLKIEYKIDSHGPYQSSIEVDALSGAIVSEPPLGRCGLTDKRVPVDCLGTCVVSKISVLRDLLEKSEISDQHALPEHMTVCAITGKRVNVNETAQSDVTGKQALKTLMKISGVSGKKGEPNFFKSCEFTNIDALITELATSQVSGKKYRLDQEAVSTVSGKRGHQGEFARCTETSKVLLPTEGERCDVTGHFVAPGILVRCEISRKHVLPSLTERCSVSGKCVLREHLTASFISQLPILKTLAIVSANGSACLPNEAVPCDWDGTLHHPADAVKCSLTGATVCRTFLTGNPLILKSLAAILAHPDGLPNAPVDSVAVLAALTATIGKGNYKIARTLAAPNGHSVAVTIVSSAWLGWKKMILGLIFSSIENRIIGNVTEGQIKEGRWHELVK